jgi:hypothetical protein
MFKRTLQVLLTLALLVASATTVFAQETEIGETAVTIPAGGEARIDFEAYCMETGKVFPEQLYTPAERAPEDVLRVLKAAILNDMVADDPLQTQIALWYQINGDWPYAEGEVDREGAQELLDAAEDVQIAPLSAEGTSINEAVANGTISIDAENFRSTSADTPDGLPYRGEGTLVVMNETDEEVTVYFPFGMVIESTNENEQDIVAYSTEQKQLPEAGGLPFSLVSGMVVALTGLAFIGGGLVLRRARKRA